jgi:predicted TIM-barrel fold metal-dependent hydrolase
MTARYTGPIIDAHHHLWDMSLDRHPWLKPGDGAIKALGDISFMRRDYLPADFLSDIGPQNVTGSVYIEAVWDRTRPPTEEMDWVANLAKPPGIAARMIGWAPLAADDVTDTLDALAARPGVVGLRESIRWHPDPAKRWTEDGILDQPLWRRGLAQMAKRGLMLELLMNPYQSEAVAHLAHDFPDQQIIINHCATPTDRDEAGLARWRAGLTLMAGHPNIAIKLSNYPAYASERTVPGFRQVIMTLLDAFGTDRAMFGTDYPVGARTMGYQDVCERFKDVITDLSAAEQRDLFYGNAVRIYRF